MKKLTLILAALALTLGLSQCKKAETPTTDEGVFITLTAGYGNGAKTDFAPATGSFVWTEDATEYIYVGGSNHTGCLGVLSGTGTGTGSMTFSGTLTKTPNEGETLHFFYLGKDRDGSAVSSLDFSNQSIGSLASLTNFHIAVGDGSYSDNTVNYATTLHMAVSFAYFNVDGFKNAGNATETVYLHGNEVYSTATINYRAGTITGEAKGNINLGTASDGKFVALIPSVSTETMLKFDSNSKWGAMNFLRGIQAGRYYSNSGAALTVTAGTLLAGTVPGLFSVSATEMVRFSKGNLQYDKTDSKWSFMANQYDIVEPANKNVGTDYENWSVVSLFGWGTGNNPTCTSGDFSNFYEWGNNAIVNGGNTPNSGWRTPTSDEWHYLFTSSDRSNKRFLKATILDHKGVILFPDSYDGTELTGFYSYNTSGFQSVNNDDWVKMEAVGAAFLPAAGMRNGTNGTVVNDDVGKDGAYWSSTKWREVYFNKGDDLNDQFATGNLHWGQSVRLVHNAGLIVNTDIINDVTAGGSIFSGWNNGGGDPWNDPTPGSGGNTLGGWNNDGNDPWGN